MHFIIILNALVTTHTVPVKIWAVKPIEKGQVTGPGRDEQT